MKIILTTVLMLCTFWLNAQDKRVFDSNENVTWLGLDFSHFKYVGDAAQFGDFGEINNSDLRDSYFPAWNDLFMDEQDKYNVADAIDRIDVQYAIKVTNQSNAKIKSGFLAGSIDGSEVLSEEDLKQVVQQYDFDDRDGIGMMFVVESMNKEQKEAHMWLVFADMNSKQLLFSKRIKGKAGGFGFKNYWAKTFYNALKDIERNWKRWRP